MISEKPVTSAALWLWTAFSTTNKFAGTMGGA